MFAINVPTLIVCLVAVAIILAKWRLAPNASLWALLAFGVALIRCFAMPLGQMMLQRWALQDGENRLWAFSAFAVVGSILQAVTYALLLVAVFAGRSETSVVSA